MGPATVGLSGLALFSDSQATSGASAMAPMQRRSKCLFIPCSADVDPGHVGACRPVYRRVVVPSLGAGLGSHRMCRWVKRIRQAGAWDQAQSNSRRLPAVRIVAMRLAVGEGGSRVTRDPHLADDDVRHRAIDEAAP